MKKNGGGGGDGSPQICYICDDKEIQRKKVSEINLRKTGMVVRVYTATTKTKIRKCEGDAIENRELIAHKNEKVSFFICHGRVFIKGAKGIVYVKELERIRDKLSEHIEAEEHEFRAYEGRGVEGSFVGFEFGDRLNRKETFIIWFTDEKTFNRINGAEYPPQNDQPNQQGIPQQYQAMPQQQGIPQQYQAMPQQQGIPQQYQGIPLYDPKIYYDPLLLDLFNHKIYILDNLPSDLLSPEAQCTQTLPQQQYIPYQYQAMPQEMLPQHLLSQSSCNFCMCTGYVHQAHHQIFCPPPQQPNVSPVMVLGNEGISQYRDSNPNECSNQDY